MKKVLIDMLMAGVVQAEIPYYTGKSNNRNICENKMQMFYDNEALFNDMIRQGRTFEARTLAWDMDNYFDSMTAKTYVNFNVCKQSMSKSEYKKWYGYVKKKVVELGVKGWLD
jgi:hypothetical protein